MPSKSIFFLFVIAICVIFLISYAFTGSFAFWNVITRLGTPAGILRIGGLPPWVQRVYINITTLNTFVECDPFNENICAFPIVENGIRGFRINATTYDINTDCNDDTVTAYICNNTLGTMVCNENNDAYTVALTYYARSADNFYCNYTGTFGMEYFRRYGSWRVNVTDIDTTHTPNLQNSTVRNASYPYQVAFWYPYPSGNNIDMGTISLFDAFSPSPWLAANATKNAGNVRINVTYNATDFFCAPINYINISDYAVGSNFVVGNDTTWATGTYSYINGTPTIPVEFIPPGGMRRCGNLACNQDEDNRGLRGGWANYTLYWNINVSGGTPTCSPWYSNVIEITTYRYQAAG